MKQTIRLNERELHRLISESIKRVINKMDGDNDVVQQAIDALMSIRDIVCKAANKFRWSGKSTLLGKALSDVSKAIHAVYGFSNYGEQHRRDAEIWMHEQD